MYVKHLKDVYKRQGFFVRVLFFAVAVAGCTVAAAALALPAALLGDPHNGQCKQNDQNDPVSYTHLDVYKRQVPAASNKERTPPVCFTDSPLWDGAFGKTAKQTFFMLYISFTISDLLG